MACDLNHFDMKMHDVFEISSLLLMQSTVEFYPISVLDFLQDFLVVVERLGI